MSNKTFEEIYWLVSDLLIYSSSFWVLCENLRLHEQTSKIPGTALKGLTHLISSLGRNYSKLKLQQSETKEK